MQLNNLNIAVLGAGRSGRAAARLAMKHGARVRVFDASPSIGNWPEDIPLHAAATEEDGEHAVVAAQLFFGEQPAVGLGKVIDIP